MHRRLFQSVRHIRRQRCYRCVYSTQAAVHRVASNTPSETDASNGSRTLENAEDPNHGSSYVRSRNGPTLSSIVDIISPLPADTEESRLPPNKVDAYLASLRAEGIEPTLEDLSRLAPKKLPSAKSPNYAAAYADFVDRLCRTFSKEQLRRFCQELQLDRRFSRSKRRKVEYAEAIMEKSWGWENVKEVEKRKRDASEVATKSFPVSASELFLLLGKDGSELLQISGDYNVHISVRPGPLSIRIEGSRVSIRKLEAMMTERRKSIEEEEVVLPTREPLSSSLLQQVSRTANAFIENLGNEGRIRIHAMSRQRLNLAKRLAVRAAVQIRHNLHTPFAALLPPPPSALTLESPSSYALFPFTPQRSLPWTKEVGNTFRSRKVSDWLGGGSRYFTLFSADLSGRKGRLVGAGIDASTLEDVIDQSFQDAAGPFKIAASTGHVLIMGVSRHHRSSILPPLPGRWYYSELLDWMKDDDAYRIFVPCLPLPLHSTPPTQEKIVHRLTYRLVQKKKKSNLQSQDGKGTEFIPMKTFRAEMIINRQRLEEPEQSFDEPSDLDADEDHGEWTLQSELDRLLIDDHTQLDPPSTRITESVTHLTEETPSDRDVGETDTASAVVQPPGSSIEGSSDKASSGIEAPSSDVHEIAAMEGDDTPDPISVDQSTAETDPSEEPSCCRGRELELLVALPDKPMDLKFIVQCSLEAVPIKTIPELKEYFDSLRTYLDSPATESSPPEPPLFIEDGEDKYILDLNASVRQSIESLDVGHDTSFDLDSAQLDDLGERRILTTTESIYDLESGQKLVNCELACKGTASGESWTSFLTDIDYITSYSYKTKQISATSNLFSLGEEGSNEGNELF